VKTIIVGFDAFDPTLFERLHAEGKLPNLGSFVARGYRRFAVSNPPQSEVSWTSIATGLNPGGHGMFDFVHRNPANYGLQVSLLPTKTSAIGTQFVPPHNAHTIFEQAIDDGYPATVMWWPATFPARIESPVQVFPGLGAPDIQGRLGVGTHFTVGDAPLSSLQKTPWARLTPAGGRAFTGALSGPAAKTRSGTRTAQVGIRLEITGAQTAALRVASQTIELTAGQWSPIIEVVFAMGFLVKVRALTRFILTRAGDEPQLYALPLQPHPLRAPWRYAAPPGFVKNTWQSHGPFLTLGWPQDTTALEEGLIDDAQFLALCDSIFEKRRQIFLAQLAQFREGILATVFDTLDRVQHMFWRDRPDVIEGWYRKLDAFAGEILARAPRDARLIFVSDHGFARFDHKIHLNKWLMDNGYLTQKPGAGAGFTGVDWSQSSAYALGLNSLYLNQQGREGQGRVPPAERDAALSRLRDALLAWRAPDGSPVFHSILTQAEAFHGDLAPHGPDLVLGYAPGYRASQETGTGNWGASPLEPNRDHWGADHCIAAEAVPGVIFASRGLEDFPAPSYRDFPALALGKAFKTKGGAAQEMSAEDQDAVEERLKGLGYL
jgi:predicted AlkP superfamily phosphohydrolase/phosphomutase